MIADGVSFCPVWGQETSMTAKRQQVKRANSSLRYHFVLFGLIRMDEAQPH
jgi:hypothetical protein